MWPNFLWACYLSASWTWCLGLVMPALLLRDYGEAGFWVLAIPDVLGAAAFAWWITSVQQSKGFVKKHRTAMLLFSLITMSFQVYVLASLIFPRLGLIYIAVVAVIMLMTLIIKRQQVYWFAVPVTLLTVALWLQGGSSNTTMHAANSHLLQSVWWLLPVSILGFVLCPYLDLTLHHARQQIALSNQARWFFVLGFAGFFFISLLWVRQNVEQILLLLNWTDGESAWLWSVWLVLSIQIGFTLSAHWEQFVRQAQAPIWYNGLYTVTALSLSLPLLVSYLPDYAGMSASELTYRMFLVAYGLFFPAYLLFGWSSLLSKAGLLMLALLIPFYWVGFIEGYSIAIALGVVLLLAIWRFAFRRVDETEIRV